jgi:MFS family permease
LLRPRLLRIPACAAGLGVTLAFGAGLQGFFLMFALWLQAGEHFSPLKAGLTALALSVGCLFGAPAAVPLAQKYGRRVLVSGGLLMAAGTAGVLAVVSHVGVGGSPWPIVPGLVVAGAGLALLVIPLANVVLATVFFGWVTSGHTFAAATTHTGPYAAAAFMLCALLSLLLPHTAVSGDALIGTD